MGQHHPLGMGPLPPDIDPIHMSRPQSGCCDDRIDYFFYMLQCYVFVLLPLTGDHAMGSAILGEVHAARSLIERGAA